MRPAAPLVQPVGEDADFLEALRQSTLEAEVPGRNAPAPAPVAAPVRPAVPPVQHVGEETDFLEALRRSTLEAEVPGRTHQILCQ